LVVADDSAADRFAVPIQNPNGVRTSCKRMPQEIFTWLCGLFLDMFGHPAKPGQLRAAQIT
jgi:hypothetical protein